MKTFLKANWIIITILSIATGVFKMLQQEADILLFQNIGFSVLMTSILGGIQLLGGILLVFPKTRKIGAYIMLPTFIIASIAVFSSGMIGFGIVSLLFIAMTYLVILMENKYSFKNLENE